MHVGMVGYVAVLALIAGFPYVLRLWRLKPVVDALRELGAEPARLGNTVTASIGGLALSYELRPGQERVPDQTLCTARLSEEFPDFEMQLRPQTASEVGHIEHGRAVDIQLGDERFDDSFVVEAAPARLARALLDAPFREALAHFFPCRLTWRGREIRFEKYNYVRRPAEGKKLVELFRHAGAQALVARAGPAEQGEPAAIATAQAPPEASVELAALHAARGRRSAWRARRMILAVSLGAVAGAGYWLLRTACEGHP
jgi:hypothetical protein